MSTRSVIGQRFADGSLQAVYCHFDGYPAGVGNDLLQALRKWGDGSEGRLIELILSEKIGWSTLGYDLDLPPIWRDYDMKADKMTYILKYSDATRLRLHQMWTKDNHGYETFDRFLVEYVTEKAPLSYTVRGEKLAEGVIDNHFRTEAEIVESWCEWYYLVNLEEQLIEVGYVGHDQLHPTAVWDFVDIHNPEISLDFLLSAANEQEEEIE